MGTPALFWYSKLLLFYMISSQLLLRKLFQRLLFEVWVTLICLASHFLHSCTFPASILCLTLQCQEGLSIFLSAFQVKFTLPFQPFQGMRHHSTCMRMHAFKYMYIACETGLARLVNLS